MRFLIGIFFIAQFYCSAAQNSSINCDGYLLTDTITFYHSKYSEFGYEQQLVHYCISKSDYFEYQNLYHQEKEDFYKSVIENKYQPIVHQLVTSSQYEIVDPYAVFYIRLFSGDDYLFKLPDCTYTVNRRSLLSISLRESKPNAYFDLYSPRLSAVFIKKDKEIASVIKDEPKINYLDIKSFSNLEFDKVKINVYNNYGDTLKMVLLVNE